MKISRYDMSFGLFPDNLTTAIRYKKEEQEELKKLNLSEIKTVHFPDDQYYKIPTEKNQIVLHHTVSGEGVEGDIRWWLMTKERIATHLILDWKGVIYQCYSSKYWGHHLGVKQLFLNSQGFADYKTRNRQLNKNSIGIEIDSWGGLVEYQDKWYPAKWDKKKKKNIPNLGVKPIKNVVKYSNGFRGFYGYEKYTDEQIESLRQVLVYFNEKYGISLKYNEDMWDVSKKALAGKNGIWTHVSYRLDKSDLHPQEELITMLKNLE